MAIAALPKAACFSCHLPPGATTRHPERMHEDSTWYCPYL